MQISLKRIKHLYHSLAVFVRKRLYMCLATGIFILALIGATIFILATRSTHHYQPKTVSATKSSATESKDKNAGSKPPESDGQLSRSEQPTTASSSPSTPTTSPAGTLLISPGTLTVKPGEPINITLQASNGKAINYPGLTSYNSMFLMNFAAGPAKKVWTGPIIMMNYPHYPNPGTYVLQVFAQDNSAAYYRGTVTVNIVEPSMQISVQSLGYDQENDAVTYLIKINRLNGFDEPITEIAASSTTEPGLVCYYAIADADTIGMACGHEDLGQARPTSGTLSIEVATDSLVRSTTTSYSLPPL